MESLPSYLRWLHRNYFMNKISARNIQVFVGGAFALDGFNSLYSLFYQLIYQMIYPRSYFNWIDLIIGGLMLPLGIGIFIGRPIALQLTIVYLWIMVILILVAIPLYCYAHPATATLVIWKNAQPLLTSITLLALIYWSRSPRFQDKSDGTISN